MQHALIVDSILGDAIAAASPGGDDDDDDDDDGDDDDDDGRGGWGFAAAELSTGSCSML